MILADNKKVFNLWDTNGRRADIINALDIYLGILYELKEADPDWKWARYPDSLSQFLFYQKAIEASPEVFKSHNKYDCFVKEVPFELLKSGQALTPAQRETLDVAIEKRARHYTNNLVKLGLAKVNREITPAGQAYHNSNVIRDRIENVMPIATTNLLVLRQLLKFKTYTAPDSEGNRVAYSPFFMALYLLLSGTRFDEDDFKTIIQALTPYNPQNPDSIIEQCQQHDYTFAEREYTIPEIFKRESIVSQSDFEKNISNTKSGSALVYYYEFYKRLYDYYLNPSDKHYARLKATCLEDPNKLRQAFGNGKKVFDFGRSNTFDHEAFKSHNSTSPFLIAKHFNQSFYSEYIHSKITDEAREYADTTGRLLSATGLISLGKGVPALVNSDIYELIFDREYLRENIFSIVSPEDYDEQLDQFESNLSLCQILSLSTSKQNDILATIASKLGKGREAIKQALKDRTSQAFVEHIKINYPKEKVANLLKGFSDSDGGAKARTAINPSCGIPTAYEYIVAIAWYYISDSSYDLYSSMNLTMGADFEPERFAPGGAGDIVAEYDDIIIMLEATMMNPQTQKRGEWEPVLRHSVNLRVESAPKDTLTIFVANELDFNTINIWRAVAMVPLKASNADIITNGVAIMPITSNELSYMLDNNVKSSKLIKAIKDSYTNHDYSFDNTWRETLLSSIGI